MKGKNYIGIPLSHTQFTNSQRYVNLIITEKLYPKDHIALQLELRNHYSTTMLQLSLQ